MPWCKCSTCLFEHFIDSFLILIPFFTIAPVFIRNLPLFFRVVLPLRKTFQLRIFVDLYPEFNNHSAPVMQFFFKLINFIIRTFPVIFTAESLKTFHHNTSIPCTVKNCDMSILRKPCPKSPEIMSCFFMRLRTCDRLHLISARIQRTGDSLDVSALSGSIPSFIGNNYRYTFTIQAVMQFSEPAL